VGVKNGRPVLEEGRVLEVANVIWCTGFHPGFWWIDLPVLKEGEPVHHRGVVGGEPGLYFVGLHFLYALSSTMIHGVGRDAEHIAETIAARGRGTLAPGPKPADTAQADRDSPRARVTSPATAASAQR
jgi:putative flavoprotein involved in K+ transport